MVAGGAGDRGGHEPVGAPTQWLRCCDHPLQSDNVGVRITHNTAFADPLAPHFKLRFHQHHSLGVFSLQQAA